MNTTVTTKRAANPLGVSTIILSILALVAAAGILALAIYIGALSASPAQNADTYQAVMVPGAANGLLAQRQGEWSNADTNIQDSWLVKLRLAQAATAYFDQRRGEWTVASTVTANSYLDQRRGERLAGADTKYAECNTLTNTQERARCYGVR